MPSEAGSRIGRLHPATLVFRILGHTRALLVPALLVLLFSRGERWEIWLAALFVPTVIFDVFQYLTLRWRFEKDELVIEQGWIFRRVRHVPYARVQNVDLKQGLLHRLARVAEVKIETAGGGASDAELKVIGLAQYESLRAHLFAGRAAAQLLAARADGCALPPPVPQATETLLRLGPKELLMLALDPGRGLGLIFIAWGFAWEFNLLDRLDLGDQLEDWFAAEGAMALATQAAFALAAVMLLVFLLSAIASVLSFWDFCLEQEGEVFRIRRGLLTRQVASIPRSRIQVLTVRRSLLHRMLGRARVLVGTAGGDQNEQHQGHESGAQFAPLMRNSEIQALLTRIRPDLNLSDLDWQPLGQHAGRRMMVVPTLTAVTIGALLYLMFDMPGALAGAVVLLLAWVRAGLRWRISRWARPAWGMVWRSGSWSVSVSATFHDKLQAVTLAENPLDRRNGHATLLLDTAGGAKTGHPLAIPYLPRALAARMQAELAENAAAMRFRW